MKISLALILSLFFYLSSVTVNAKTISIMNYNAENLFDTIHDEGKEDYTYLPLSIKKASQEIQDYCNGLAYDSWKESCLKTDWNDDVLDAKIMNLSKVIKAYNKGKGADIVVLQEVENKNVLELLVSKGLKDLGYNYISLVEGPDSRGIDVGILSKFPIVSEQLHLIDLVGIAKPSRGILEVQIKVGSKTITVFGNHWPSQHNPSEARFAASEKLIELANKSRSNIVVATGDFNTLPDETPNGVENLSEAFIDVEKRARKLLFKSLWSGTHWYKGHWGSLDKVFVLKRITKAKVKTRSFDILAYKFLLGDKELVDDETGVETTYNHVPLRFDLIKKTGYSDHLPIAVKIKL
jgi:endonuclease/exonuclease/phosphatase family metal-dependent hydrolase